MTTNNTRLFITGDIAQDYFLIRGERLYADDHHPDHPGTRMVHHQGGAYLIYELLEQISVTRKAAPDQVQFENNFGYKEEVFDTLPDRNKSYVSVKNFGRDKNKIWRIDEFVGFGNSSSAPVDLSAFQRNADSGADIFILDDAGVDFFADNNKAEWSVILEALHYRETTNRLPFVVLKKSGDFERTLFFDELSSAAEKGQINLLTILSIDDVRKLNVKVSSGLSWEQSATDLVTELNANEHLRYLCKSTFLVITFHSSGALFVVNNGTHGFEYSLVFDPEKMEGEDGGNNLGNVIGRMSTFTAALASQLNLEKKDKHYKIENAIKAGLSAVRNLYECGYNYSDGIFSYPFLQIAESMAKAREFPFSSAPVPGISEFADNWSILINNYSEKQAKQETQIQALTALAKNIVQNGPELLKNIPSGRFGNLFTIDRNEIESLRNLKKIMETYIQHDPGKKPLSIAVFGPPGAGKSFAVEEIGKGILGENFHILVFNLSQFNSPDDLTGALHQVRDSVIKKEIPIVFWDEFDAQSYMWLQYLLAPMQDGTFQEGQITHPVGKCIFVFAGATSYNINAFGKFRKEEEIKDFILKKGPDFISRLNGYINILGPNKRQLFNENYEKEEDKWQDDDTDITYPLRRAIFIIGLLRLKKSDFPLSMDQGLLNAFIKVGRYKHGSRSLANLINDIRQNNPKKQLQRSWLPSKSTLGLYFNDLSNFNDCMVKEEDFMDRAWEFAPLIHSYWMNKINDPFNQYSVEFSFLPVFIKESNVQSVRRIPEVLKSGGFRLVAKDTAGVLAESEYLQIIRENNEEILSRMAEKEHDQWWKFHADNGWEYDAVRNDYAKKHPCMIPYKDLSKREQDKDIEIIKHYPEILDKAGFGIVKF